jgi:hypothetical protein
MSGKSCFTTPQGSGTVPGGGDADGLQLFPYLAPWPCGEGEASTDGDTQRVAAAVGGL